MNISLGNVLIVTAHPDDAEINAGGLISKISRENNSPSIMIMTHNLSYRFIESQQALNILLNSSDETHSHNKIYHKDYQDTQLYLFLTEMIKDIDNLVKNNNINTIITHHPSDSHQDHNAVCRAVCASSRLINNLIFFKPTAPSTMSLGVFTPNLIVPLDKSHISLKIDSLKYHKSQIDKYGSDIWLERIMEISKADAWTHGRFHGYAEVYEISRIRI